MSFRAAGLDSDFPWFSEEEYLPFPDPADADKEGLLTYGGNLSPGVLLSAYKQGIFPWFSPGDPLLWWSPDPRCLIYPEKVHISKSMKKQFRKKEFSFSFDTCFADVIDNCAKTYRPGQFGTWISQEMRAAYLDLHKRGYCHSVEVWKNKRLAGGLYGISLGSSFFGESMFSLETNSSKSALIMLALFLQRKNFMMIDCQIVTTHLLSLGASSVPRKNFLEQLETSIISETIKGNWNQIFPEFRDFYPSF